MTKINHRRKSPPFPKGVKQVYNDGTPSDVVLFDNGYKVIGEMHKPMNRLGIKGLSVQSELSGKSYCGRLGYSVSNGRRGEAKSMRKIKQGVHRALRSHERQLTEKLAKEHSLIED